MAALRPVWGGAVGAAAGNRRLSAGRRSAFDVRPEGTAERRGFGNRGWKDYAHRRGRKIHKGRGVCNSNPRQEYRTFRMMMAVAGLRPMVMERCRPGDHHQHDSGTQQQARAPAVQPDHFPRSRSTPVRHQLSHSQLSISYQFIPPMSIFRRHNAPPSPVPSRSLSLGPIGLVFRLYRANDRRARCERTPSLLRPYCPQAMWCNPITPSPAPRTVTECC